MLIAHEATIIGLSMGVSHASIAGALRMVDTIMAHIVLLLAGVLTTMDISIEQYASQDRMVDFEKLEDL